MDWSACESVRALCWVALCLLAVVSVRAFGAAGPDAGGAGETLHNGIVLPMEWPPRTVRLTREPAPVPYLENPPAVIPIDVGRQLFVDDFLIEKTTLRRTLHRAEYHPVNPVIKPEEPWETAGKAPMAYAYSGGAWYDPGDRLFKLWYSAGLVLPGMRGYGTNYLCFAISTDGVRWDKPLVDGVKPGSNVVLEAHHDSTVVWLDHNAADRNGRFKYFATEKRGGWHLVMRTSPDGVRWTDRLVSKPIWGDRTTAFHDPFRKVWILSQRIHGGEVGRCRSYLEDADARRLVEKTRHNPGMKVDGESVFWTCADKLDPRNPDPAFAGIDPQLYNLDAAPYESLMLGLFAIWTGPDNRTVARMGLQKRCDLLVGFSRDGFHWHRPCRVASGSSGKVTRRGRERFIAASWKDGAWNFGNIQSAGGGCLVVGGKLYFYVSARPRDPSGWHGRANTALAVLRRDGFASMDAEDRTGTLTTRPVTFKGRYLFVNVDCPNGELRVEVLDGEGKGIAPFTAANCRPIACDKTLAALTWRGAGDLRALAGGPLRFRFHLKNGSLYAFWVSPEESGASHGYVAAGGPGFTGPTDTAGSRAYASARKTTRGAHD